MTAKNSVLLITLFAFYLLTACNLHSSGVGHQKKRTNHRVLKAQKAHIDSLLADTDMLITLVKPPNNAKLVLVKGNNWPDEIETTYNIYKDSSGKVIYVAEIPESESGDWFVAYRSYFDDAGKLFAFVKETSFFNGACSGHDDVVHEKLIKYYDNKDRVTDSLFKIVDQNGKRLKKLDCMDDRNFPYKVISKVSDYLSANNLQGY